MASERTLGIRCKCGGRLKRSVTEVEFFGIDFGMKEAESYTEWVGVPLRGVDGAN